MPVNGTYHVRQASDPIPENRQLLQERFGKIYSMARHLLSESFAIFKLEKSAVTVYGLRVAGAFLTFVLQIFLARWIGQYEYGIFALVWSCIIIFGEFLSFGFYNLIQRLIPQYQVSKQPNLLRGAVWGAARMIVLCSTAIAIICALAIYAFYSAQTLPEKYAFALIIGALSLPAFALADYISGINRSFGLMVRAFSPAAIFRPIAIIGLLAGTVALGYSASAITAISCATIAVWLTLFVSIFTARTALPKETYSGPREYNLRPWIIAALPMMMISSLELLLFNVDVLMISYYLPPDQTGIYFAATKIMALVAFLNFAVGSAYTNSYAKLHAEGTKDNLAAIIRRSASLTFYPSALMILVILFFRNEILSLFGAGFESAEMVIFPLALGLLCRAFVGPGERVLMMTGHQHICAKIYLSTVIIDIILNLILIPPFGIIGAAIATATAFAVMAVLLHFAVRKHLSINASPATPQKLIAQTLANR